MKCNKALLFILSCCLGFSSSAQWTYIGLSHAGITTNLTITNDTLYASTHDGIYKKHVLSADTNWIPCGMQGNHVVQTLAPDNQNFICVVEIGASYTTQIYKTTNWGATFNLMNPDTSNFGSYQFLNAIAHPEGNYDTLYFLNHQLKTYNGGLTWDTIANLVFNDRFIHMNPLNHTEVIIGGETFILSAYLQVSPDNGANWNYPAMTGYFSGDNCAHDMIFDNNNAWTAAGEGVICRTTDGGDNWTQLLNVWSWPAEWQLYFWDIEMSPADSNKIYVTGENSTITQVPLYYSQDNGMTWDTLSSAAAFSPPSIKCLAVKNISTGDKVFLGGNGVYVYENIFIGIDETQMETRFVLYPNPAPNQFTIYPEPSGRFTISEIEIYNVLGKKIFSEPVTRNQKQVTVDVSNVPPGMYFVRIVSEKEQLTKKVVVQH